MHVKWKQIKFFLASRNPRGFLIISVTTKLLLLKKGSLMEREPVTSLKTRFGQVSVFSQCNASFYVSQGLSHKVMETAMCLLWYLPKKLFAEGLKEDENYWFFGRAYKNKKHVFYWWSKMLLMFKPDSSDHLHNSLELLKIDFQK